MNTTSALSKLSGTLARLSPFKRKEQRFLCPNCLHFGGFDFACGECWAEIPGYANKNKIKSCPRCWQSLLSVVGGGVRAYCKQCKGNCDRAIYHQRQVRVVATLRPADSQSLYRAISGQEYQPQGGKGYLYDDGARLVFVLNLNDFTNEAHSLPPTHPLWEAKSIWLDVLASNPKELALELGEVADRFIAQTKLTEAQRQAMTVCVHQVEVDSEVRPVLETRFGKVRYGVTGAVFLFERAQSKVVAQEEIGHNSTVPELITALKDNNAYAGRGAVEALGKISDKTAVPVLIAALNHRDWDVRRGTAEALVKIGEPAVPTLIVALKDSNSETRKNAAATLKKIGNDTVARAQIAALNSDDADVRRKAVKMLVRIGEPSVRPLIAALKDSDLDVREKAAEVLVRIGKFAVPALIAACKDSDLDVREKAAEVLGEIGDNVVVPALRAMLKNSNSDERKNATEALCALCEIGNDSAMRVLIATLKNSDLDARRAAAEMLAGIGELVVRALIAALNADDSDVRKKAAEMLVKIGKPAVSALEAADREGHRGSACKFCDALRRLGAK